MDTIETPMALPAPEPNAVPALAPRNWLRFVIDHNPFFLLSAISMLLGCRLLNEALHTSAGDVQKLLLLLGVVNVYEVLIILLGLALLRRPWPVRRDGITLLVLEALFLTDVTFTTTVISTVDVGWGTLINLGVMLLAAVKLFVILRSLHVPRAARLCFFVLVVLALLVFTPTVFKVLAMPRNGKVPALAVYCAWCVAGVLPVLGTLLHKLPPGPRRIHIDAPAPPTWVAPVYVLLPFASLLVHLYSAAWVYSVDFDALYLAPVMLGTAIALDVLAPKMGRRVVLRLQTAMVVGAVYFSSAVPADLIAVPSSLLTFSPLRFVLFASALICLYLAYLHRRSIHLTAGVVALCAACLGHSLPAIRENLEWIGRQLFVVARHSTPTERGVAAVAVSFVLLSVGAWVSLRRQRLEEMPPAVRVT